MTRTAVLWMVAASLLAIGGGRQAGAQNAASHGNAEAGQQFALRHCDSCHIVAAKQDLAPMPNYGPSFVDIAKRPDVAAQTQQAFLSKSHPGIKMPYPDLTAAQIADVSAYLLSLRGRR
jgi:mono/diheme cytochrome c family protein